MSICSYMIQECPSNCLRTAPKQNIQDELIWGLTYRNYKEQERNRPIRPLHSPIDIPFKLCRAELLLGKRNKSKKEVDTNELDEEESHKSSASAKKRKREQMEKPSLLERSVMSQSKYMNFLSQPNPTFYQEPKRKKWKRRCELEPCPPRFVQLAVPNRRRVFANWKEFCDFLPAEMLKRFDDILHTDQNLEPREARYYFKKLDRERRKKLREKKRLEKRKQQLKGDPAWLKQEIDLLGNAIVDYLKDEPLFSLNYKQLLLSDGILERLENINLDKKNEKVPKLKRNTKDYYKKTIIEVGDKCAVWIDTLTKFVDVQTVDSEIDIPPVSVTSLEAEGEGETSYADESEEEKGSSEGEGEEKYLKEYGEENLQDIIKENEDIINDIFRIEEGEDEGDLNDFINDLDEDQLDKLIEILSNCSDEFLSSEVDAEKMPGVKYEDILQRLKDIKNGISPEDKRQKPFLERVIIDWAMQNDPDKVDKKLLTKIKEVAALLEDMLGQPDVDGETNAAEREVETEGDEGNEAEKEDETAEDLGALDEAAEGEEEEMPGASEEPRGTEDFGYKSDIQGAEEGPSAEDVTEGEERAELEEPVAESEIPTEAEGEVTDFEDKDKVGDQMGLGEEDITTDLEGLEEDEGLFIPEDEGVRPPPEEQDIRLPEAEKLPSEDRPVTKKISSDSKKDIFDGAIIKGHKPSRTFEHAPDTVCCLSLKLWAVWLLEISHNAHNWTKWMAGVIQQVREFASTVRGDVKNSDGSSKLLKKSEWRQFCKETEENVVAWRQYSAHVKDLSNNIIENFRGKKVNCCPKCLEDHLIKNVVIAHETLQSLTEAINCAAYWQRTLDGLVGKIAQFSELDTVKQESSSSESSSNEQIIEELSQSDDEDEVFEIEGTDLIPPEENKEEPPAAPRKASGNSKDSSSKSAKKGRKGKKK